MRRSRRGCQSREVVTGLPTGVGGHSQGPEAGLCCVCAKILVWRRSRIRGTQEKAGGPLRGSLEQICSQMERHGGEGYSLGRRGEERGAPRELETAMNII